jgi:hypothetical protein
MKIAAVCASSLSHNSGMITVDLALLSLVSELGQDVTVDLFTTENAHRLPGETSVLLDYQHLTDQAQLDGYDRVLYWGDFLQSRAYQIKDIARRAEETQGLTLAQCDDQVHFPLLMLEGASDALLAKTICTGGSIYINRAEDDGDRRYHAAMTRLYTQSRPLHPARRCTGHARRRFGVPAPPVRRL